MRIVVILGGNSGIGKATAEALAKKNYRVIIHGHNEQKTLAAVQEIKAASGNSNIDSVSGDLSAIKGMKKTIGAISSKTDTIDALVLSTGTILSERVETADGLEYMFAS